MVSFLSTMCEEDSVILFLGTLINYLLISMPISSILVLY